MLIKVSEWLFFEANGCVWIVITDAERLSTWPGLKIETDRGELQNAIVIGCVLISLVTIKVEGALNEIISSQIRSKD